MNTEAEIALTDAELAELDAFLLDDDERLTIDEAHGYLTALIVSRNDVDETAVLEAVLGKAESRERISKLLLRHYLDQHVTH